MLRKRTRSIHKDQHKEDRKMTITDADQDYSSQTHAMKNNFKSNSIFNTPLLFVGLGPKGVLDSDSVRSPTSPLDTLLSTLGNPFRSPKSPSPSLPEGQQRIWDFSKVGLGIIDSLEDCPKFSGKIILSSENKKPNFTLKVITNAPNSETYSDSIEASKSLPKYFCKLPYTQNGTNFHKGESTVLFVIGETFDHDHEPFGKTRSFSLDSLTGSNTDSGSKNFALDQVSPPHFIGGDWNSNMLPVGLTFNPVSIYSSDEFTKVLSASEIELSEDYTCVISHGPNPKKTHIFRDFILETHSDDSQNHYKNEENEKGVSSLVFNNRFRTPNKYCSGDFLNFCYRCNKKLEDGEDIYIYRGEKSFCSISCRDMEIMYDEELEESNPSSENSPKLKFGGNLFEPGIPTAA